MSKGYETAPFGDGISTARVQDVSNQYGPREVGGTVGIVKTEGSKNEASFTFGGTEVLGGDWVLETDFKLPAGAIVKNVYVEVQEALSTGGDVLIGTDGSEAANGFVIPTVSIEAVGTYDVTSSLIGTWTAPLAAETVVSLAAVGTAVEGGKAKVIVEYVSVGA